MNLLVHSIVAEKNDFFFHFHMMYDIFNSRSMCKVRTIQVDPINHQGFSPLMKAALQGRIKCSKLLLFSGKCMEPS